MPFIADRVFDYEPVVITEKWGLKDIEPGALHSRVNSVGCIDCETIFQDLRFGKAEINRLYQDYRGEEYNLKREAFEPDYKQKSKIFNKRYPYLAKAENWIEQYIEPNIILEWGGGSGFNSMFKNDKHILYVYDVSGVAVEEGINEFSTQVNVNFDLITCNQVLEHVPNPLEILDEIRTAMQPETLLYFDVPFENLMQSRSSIAEKLQEKRYWHEHINFFSENGINKLINRANFNVIDIKVASASNIGGKDLIFQVLCNSKSNVLEKSINNTQS